MQVIKRLRYPLTYYSVTVATAKRVSRYEEQCIRLLCYKMLFDAHVAQGSFLIGLTVADVFVFKAGWLARYC